MTGSRTGRTPAVAVSMLAASALFVAACGSDDRATAAASVVSAGFEGPVQSAPDPAELETGEGQSAVIGSYSIGEFEGIDIWVDPVSGNDANDGHDRDHAMQTVNAAWQAIPSGTQLQTGYRVRLVAGSYSQATSVNYWEDRHGTASAPVIVEAADGAHTATFEGDINMFDVSHFALIGVDIVGEGDAFHCESCDHILISDAELSGGADAHETVKFNQSQHVYIEYSDIHGADDNAIDFVAVQYGHVIGSRIHDAQDWCMYAKGGSAYITFSGNEVFDCGTGGITAGQGTGFEFMVAPFLNYEAYGIQIVNNVVHDTEGAGLGVAGGFNVMFAYNTLYNVGTRSHLVEFVHGRRGCDGAIATCTANHDAGGWGSADNEEPMIPNRHISFVDNIIVNPAGVQSEWQQIQVDGPLQPVASSGVPSPSLADDDLRIEGNIIWNGPADHPLGLGDGCADTNATCNETQLRAANAINTIEPRLRDPANGDYMLADESRAQLIAAVDVPAFIWDGTPLTVPVLVQEADVSTDFAGVARVDGGPPGAG